LIIIPACKSRCLLPLLLISQLYIKKNVYCCPCHFQYMPIDYKKKTVT
jgi:hypothetical protein